jgi:hypothetical protein
MAHSLGARVFGTGVRMSAATASTMMLASLVHRGSPWTGLNAMTNALGLGRRRPKAKFEGASTWLGLGVLVGGLFLTAAIYEAIARSPDRRGMLSGALVGMAGFAVDRFLLPDALVRSLRYSLGSIGTVAKYTALGVSTITNR